MTTAPQSPLSRLRAVREEMQRALTAGPPSEIYKHLRKAADLIDRIEAESAEPACDKAEKFAGPGWWCSREMGHDGPCAAYPPTVSHDGANSATVSDLVFLAHDWLVRYEAGDPEAIAYGLDTARAHLAVLLADRLPPSQFEVGGKTDTKRRCPTCESIVAVVVCHDPFHLGTHDEAEQAAPQTFVDWARTQGHQSNEIAWDWMMKGWVAAMKACKAQAVPSREDIVQALRSVRGSTKDYRYHERQADAVLAAIEAEQEKADCPGCADPAKPHTSAQAGGCNLPASKSRMFDGV